MSGVQKLKLVAIKLETTYNTDAFGGTPAADDWFAVAQEASLTPVANLVERGLAHASGDMLPAMMIPSHCDVVIPFDIKGAEVAGDAPVWDPFMRASGHAIDTSGPSDVVYSPSTLIDMTTAPSFTIYMYELATDTTNAKLYKSTGVRGRVTISGTESQAVRGTFTGVGAWYQEAAFAAAPAAPTAYKLATDYLVFQGATATLGGNACELISFEMATRGETYQRRAGTAAAGLAEVTLVPALPTISMEFGRATQASFEAIRAGYVTASTFAFSLELGSGITIAAPSVQFEAPGKSEGSPTTYPCNASMRSDLSSGGDDSYTITVGAA